MGTQKNRLDDTLFWAPKHVFRVMDKKIIKILRWNILLDWPYAYTKVPMHVCLVFNVAYQQKLELCFTSKMVHVNSQKDMLAMYEISLV